MYLYHLFFSCFFCQRPILVCPNGASHVFRRWGFSNSTVQIITNPPLRLQTLGCLFGPPVSKWISFLGRLRFTTPTKAVIYRVRPSCSTDLYFYISYAPQTSLDQMLMAPRSSFPFVSEIPPPPEAGSLCVFSLSENPCSALQSSWAGSLRQCPLWRARAPPASPIV